jgi:hypothetical protein
MENAEGPAPAVDPTRLLPEIIPYYLSEGDASRLAFDEKFTNATFRAHQIVRLHEFASTDLHIPLSARAVAHAFNVSHSTITRAKLRGYEDPPARGRHADGTTSFRPIAKQRLLIGSPKRQQTIPP